MSTDCILLNIIISFKKKIFGQEQNWYKLLEKI